MRRKMRGHSVGSLGVGSIAIAWLGLFNPARASTIFNDTFSSGSTIDGAISTPTSSSTSYEAASSKNASGSSISTGDLHLGLSSSTGSGFDEMEALFSTDPSPFSLVNVGDTIEYDVVFEDTNGGLLAGGTSSNVMLGLFNSGGSAPEANGVLANAGLNTTTGSSYATGGAADWVGIAGYFVPTTANNVLFVRPEQNGTGTTSANQELMGDNFGGGAFNNPTQATKYLHASNISLISNATYTADMLITYLGSGDVSVTETLYSGSGTGGTALGSDSVTSVAAPSMSFDGLGFGARNSGNSFNPVADISQITVTYTPVPEPAALAIAAIAAVGLIRRRRLT
jgi:hypothetical protein